VAASFDHDLEGHLRQLRAERGDLIKIEDVGAVVRALFGAIAADSSRADLKLYRELEALSDYIHRAKAELAQLRPHDIQSRYIASATDELDAIVGATETATNTILDTAEKLEELSRELAPEIARKLNEATTMIFQACNFQDITGQRITKVVRALKHIEERIEALVSAFGEEITGTPDTEPGLVEDPMSDAALLNGPQMPESAHDQAAIDALFKES
jgi:chemotaxis protein CheZ